MKKIIYIATVAILSSCAIVRPTDRKIYTDFADYKAYSESGFLITPQEYMGEYESIGELAIRVVPAIKLFPEEGEAFDYRGRYYDFERIKRQELIDTAVKEAMKRGANAISNFQITTSNISLKTQSGEIIDGEEYIITGFCIKTN